MRVLYEQRPDTLADLPQTKHYPLGQIGYFGERYLVGMLSAG
jgi:hypothetical protein